MAAQVTPLLRPVRLARGLSQEAMARQAGISRQSYCAIEDGTATPSTAIALRLARSLGTPVEALFRLPDDDLPTLEAEWAGPPPAAPTRVRIAQVAGRLLARPCSGPSHGLPRADGLALPADHGRVSVRLLSNTPARPGVVVLGCDPAVALLAEVLERERAVDLVWTETGSRAALAGLARGQAHLAGCHLFDEQSGRYNFPWVQRLVPFPCAVIGFAVWEQGLLVRHGNPSGVRDVADLARPGLRFVNREPGSGSRLLLESRLRRAGVPPEAIQGYEIEVSGHLAVAEAIAIGLADAGVGIRAAAVAYGLDFVPLGEERYDLVVPRHFLDLPAVEAVLDQLKRPALRAQVEALGGYDLAPMGVPA